MSFSALIGAVIIASWSASQTRVIVPSEIRGEYILAASSIVENQTITFKGTEDKPALLVFQGNGSQLRYSTFRGNGKVVFWNCSNIIAQGNTFHNGTGPQLHLVATPNAKVLDNTFNGSGNTDSLLLIEPGHQWQLPDAAKYGHKLNPSARFAGGQNRLQQINPLKEERRGYYSGGEQLRIEYGRLIPTYEPSAARFNKWLVWGRDNIVRELRLISADKQGITLAASGLKPGPVRFVTYNPAALISGVLVKGNKLFGPGQLSGFSGYGLNDALIEDNLAANFADYGLGIEISSGTFRRNTGYGNQFSNEPGRARTWNQFEVVAPIGKVNLIENNGIVGETTWYYPQGLISSDRETRKPKPEWATIR